MTVVVQVAKGELVSGTTAEREHAEGRELVEAEVVGETIALHFE